ncbi:MAG: hypothetical protein IH804_03195, partial [Planctomycetes bacterium]|nr:hypothetical protein [Planctomycetota bacterium]
MAGETAPPASRRIRFNFKGATFDQVIDFFSRVSGLPVVKEADVPDGTLDYLSPREYDLPEALRVLNIILQAKGVMLRTSKDMLYLQKLSQMQREDIPTYVGELPADVMPNEIITVVRPLNMALAKPLAEKLAAMVAEYGSITAMDQQNSLVITETAAQVRRLLRIIDELDRADPDGLVEIFPIKHAKATDLMEPLKSLLARRVEKYVIDQKGKQVKIEEETLPGLSMSADERTNTIIAKGARNRLDKLRETIALLDVPAVAGGRAVRTFRLVRLAPPDVVEKLNQLYAKLPEAERPTILALDDVAKVTVVGTQSAIAEAESLLREIDGGAFEPQEPPRTIAVFALEHSDPDAVATALRTLLNGRQVVATKMLTGPDGRSLVVSGLVEDVDAIKALLPVLDRPARTDRHVRQLRLTSIEPEVTIRKARELYLKQVEPDDPKWALQSEYDGESRVLTLVGPAATLDRFAEALRMIEDNTVVDRETRQIELAHAVPSRLVAPLGALARQLLQPHDGTQLIAPTIEPVDPLHLLMVTARPEQFSVLESLIDTLDRPDPGDFAFRVVALSGQDAQGLITKANLLYDRMSQGANPHDRPPPSVEFDPLTGNLLISGRSDSVEVYERAVGQARQLLPPARTGRLIELANAKVTDVVRPLRELLRTTAPVDPARAVPEPTIEVVERTNSLYVVAEPSQHEMIERYVRRLDTFEPTELPPLRLIQVRAADAVQIADMLRNRYAARPADQRREMPVEVTADGATNTLVVTAHPEIFDEIKEFVDGVNHSGDTQAELETMLFGLKRARAEDIAQALEHLYPQPPMPRDRRGRPLPHLQKPKEVHVSAVRATNTLIIDAPAERRAQFEALVEQLDRVELPPRAELRTYHVERGDLVQIARTLNEVARQGVMSAPPADGGKSVNVIIQAEPVSRTLIVAGDEVTFAKTEQMLRDLQAVPIPRSLRVFEVGHTDPQALADRALRLYDQQTADVPGAKPVSIEVNRESSTLLVVADDEAMVRIASILNELHESIGPSPDVRLVALEYATASDIVDFLRDLAGSELARVAGRGGPPPVFEAIERTNSLLVAARPDEHEIIGALVRSLDKPETQEMPPLRILQLRTADAQNLATALTRQYNRRHPDERRQRPVSISADPNTNTLIVAVHPDLLPEIQGIVEALNRADRAGADGREIRIFPLRV